MIAVARGAPVGIDPAVVQRLEQARALVDAAADSDEPIYGLTSALGANTGKALAPEERTRYQLDTIRARAVGVGPLMDEERVRAIMFARVAGMAQGGSGVSVPVFRALVDALNGRVSPVVPSWGTISVGDLPPLSHIALVLIGEGEAFVEGRRVPGHEALARAGLTPAALGPKDGLVLVSANAATVGSACLVLERLARLFDRLDDIVALSFEGFRANLSPLAESAQAVPGTRRGSAAGVRRRRRGIRRSGRPWERWARRRAGS